MSSRQERRLQQLEDEGWIDRYKEIELSLAQDERDNLVALRRKLENGQDAHYGHDLVAAVMHGHANRARDAAHMVLRENGYATSYGRGRSNVRAEFSMGVTSLITAAAELGLDAAEMRSALERKLTQNDACSIEEDVKRHQPTDGA